MSPYRRFGQHWLLLATCAIILASLIPTQHTTFASTAVVLQPIADTRIFQRQPTRNDPSGLFLSVEYTTQNQEALSLLRFELSGLPVGATITDAFFEAFLTDGDGSTMTICAHQVVSAWNSSVTWTTRPATDAACLNAASVGPTQNQYYRWSGLVDLVRTWVNHPDTNLGLALRPKAPTIGSLAFASTEQPQTTPRLIVTYTLPIPPTATPSPTQAPTSMPVADATPLPAPTDNLALLRLDRTRYAATDCVALTLRDPAGQFSTTRATQVVAQLFSRGASDQEAVLLNRNPDGTFVLTTERSCLPLGQAIAVIGDGTLQVQPGDLIVALFSDVEGRPLLIDTATLARAPQPAHTIVQIDPAILPPQFQPISTLAAVRDASGASAIFSTDQVVLQATTPQDLSDFLARRGGQLLSTLSLPLPTIPGQAGNPEMALFYLIQISTSGVDPSELATLLDQTGISGSYTYSSQQAAQLMTLLVEEQLAGTPVAPHALVLPQGAPVSDEGGSDWFNRPWFNPSDSLRGRVRAAEALTLLALVEQRDPVAVAFVDSGFAGPHDYPAKLENPDYGRAFAAIPQRSYDPKGAVESQDASGPFSIGCPEACPWHGTQMFSVAGAALNNGSGAAGVGAPVVEPMFYKVGQPYALAVAAAIRDAASEGARVINLSAGFACHPLLADWCSTTDGSAITQGLCTLVRTTAPALAATPCAPHMPGQVPVLHPLDAAIRYATSRDALVVTGAGNQAELDVDAARVMPCITAQTLCIGALDADAAHNDLVAASFASSGHSVDLWAPGVGLTVTGTPPLHEIGSVSGTSAAAAFVSGAASLVRSVNPWLSAADVHKRLIAAGCHSAHSQRSDGTFCQPSSDKSVDSAGESAGGYLDVLDAVRQAGAPRLASLAGCDGGWDERSDPGDTSATALMLGIPTPEQPLVRTGNLSIHALPSDEDWYRFIAPRVDDTTSAELLIELGSASVSTALELTIFSNGTPPKRLASANNAKGRLWFQGFFVAGQEYLLRIAAQEPAAINDDCYGAALRISVVGGGVASDSDDQTNTETTELAVDAWLNDTHMNQWVFANGLAQAPLEAIERWTLRIAGHSLHTPTDSDRYLLQLPDSGDPAQGGIADIDPGKGVNLPLSECATVNRTDTHGNQVELLLVGSLTLQVLEAGTNQPAYGLAGQELRLYRGKTRIEGIIGPDGGLSLRIECPRVRQGLGRFTVSFGEQDESSGLLGRYDLLLEYQIVAIRNVPAWLIETFRTDERVFAVLCAGGTFPRCPAQSPAPDGRIAVTLSHPPIPLPRCSNPSPDCEAISLFAWPGGDFELDLVGSGLNVMLLDARQRSLSTVTVANTPDTVDLVMPQLAAGIYALRLSGIPTRYQVSFVPPPTDPQVLRWRIYLPQISR